MNNVLLVQYFYYILYLNIVLYIKQYIILLTLQNRASHVPISEPPFPGCNVSSIHSSFKKIKKYS